jgi:hypothetical protein|nr:MAG TPA: hypothetical protein [Caudoviricetes sp.]
MATNYLDTGDTGRAVSAESDGALFAGIFGSAKYVLENGSQFKAEVQSNNIVKISDGDAVMYGRHVRIPANDSALVTINNGHSGTNRIDLIVFRYTKDSTGKETVDLVVIHGEDSTGTATAPTAVDGNILTGAMQSDFPLYTVELNGINIVKVNPLFNVIGNISKLKEELTELNSNLTKTNTVLENRKPIIVDSTAQGTVNLDTNSFLKAGITYAFIVTVSSNISSESYKQEINCALNNVNMGNNGNYYRLTSTFAGKCTKGDKIQITSYKNGGSWNGFATRAIFIPVS